MEDRGRRDLNNRCRRWITVNQDEFRNPNEVKVERYIQSEELARYQDCKECKEAPKEEAEALARHQICCNIQNEMREPTWIPNDWHINPAAKRKPPWCRCLATKRYNEDQEKQMQREMEKVSPAEYCYKQQIDKANAPRKKVFSSTYFIDYRDPCYPYIQSKLANQQHFRDKFNEYKAKKDAEDALKEPKIAPAPPEEEDRVDPNCLCIYDNLPEPKFKRAWKPNESWWRTPTDDCRKGIVKKYIWTSTYREMNKDGAALPLAKRDIPCTSKELNANPLKTRAEMARKTFGSQKLETETRPEVRLMANRCDTMYNRPDLEHDAYFQEHRLCRAKFARCPEGHATATKENMELVKKEKLRLCYDRPIPGYGGHDCMVAPPVCKIKKNMNRWDPFEIMSNYQANYIFHPDESYASPVKPLRPDDFDKLGIANNPISTLGRMPLPDAQRLSCYLECNLPKCPAGTEICI